MTEPKPIWHDAWERKDWVAFEKHMEDIRCKGFEHRYWLNTKPDNQSKLELCYWDGEKWNGTGSVRLLPSKEWGSWS